MEILRRRRTEESRPLSIFLVSFLYKLRKRHIFQSFLFGFSLSFESFVTAFLRFHLAELQRPLWMVLLSMSSQFFHKNRSNQTGKRLAPHEASSLFSRMSYPIEYNCIRNSKHGGEFLDANLKAIMICKLSKQRVYHASNAFFIGSDALDCILEKTRDSIFMHAANKTGRLTEKWILI